MELTNLGAAEIIRQRHRPLGNKREGMDDVEDWPNAVG
jgi:hypothetical protein